MATTPKLPALQPRFDRNRTSEAHKPGHAGAEHTGVDIRAGLPPIYRDEGRDQEGGQGRGGQRGHTQMAQAIRPRGTGLFPTVGGRVLERPIFNGTSAASYHDPTVAPARWVPASATEAHRPKWMKKYSSLGGGRSITFNTPAFSAATPAVAHSPEYDIPADWTQQLNNGFIEARVNDVTDGRVRPDRIQVYNLGGRIRA